MDKNLVGQITDIEPCEIERVDELAEGHLCVFVKDAEVVERGFILLASDNGRYYWIPGWFGGPGDFYADRQSAYRDNQLELA